MITELYNYIDEITKTSCDIWIKGDSETGKTTLLKYLFDIDEVHPHRWLIGGCNPFHTKMYYELICNEIIKNTTSNIKLLSIYIDEITYENFILFKNLISKLAIPIKFVIVSHNLPTYSDNFKTYHIGDILHMRKLYKVLRKNLGFDIPSNIIYSVSDYCCFLKNLNKIKNTDDIINLYNENAIETRYRRDTKENVEHNVYIYKTPEYKHINLVMLEVKKV